MKRVVENTHRFRAFDVSRNFFYYFFFASKPGMPNLLLSWDFNLCEFQSDRFAILVPASLSSEHIIANDDEKSTKLLNC